MEQVEAKEPENPAKPWQGRPPQEGPPQSALACRTLPWPSAIPAVWFQCKAQDS